MTPIDFPQANANFGPPEGMTEQQVRTVPAYLGEVPNGQHEGAQIVVVCWKPSPEEVKAIENGEPIFLTMLGGLSPHAISTSFETATSIQ